jgi:hypothetical protein
MSGSQQLILGEGAGGSGVANYIEDVFSTYLYTGNGTSQTITNGIDLSTKGGLVWIKNRNGAGNHRLFDTARGLGSTGILNSNLENAASSSSNWFNSFNSDGFTTGVNLNSSGDTLATWTFRKQPKFFDVVTYTGNGVDGRSISHNLGSVPGCIIVKRTDQAANWAVYHRGVNGGVNPQNYKLLLNLTNAQALDNWWNNSAPTSTAFQVSSDPTVNDGATGATYVAYLFAHNAGGFGLTGTDNVISCGSFTTDSGGAASVTLGYEPQWVMTKNSSGTSAWRMFDTMRGLTVAGQNDALLQANSSAAEITNSDYCSPTATGFQIAGHDGSATHIYIAIRRGPMKTPTTGTSVFDADLLNGRGTVTTGFPVDWTVYAYPSATGDRNAVTRLIGGTRYLVPNTTVAEYDLGSNIILFDRNTSIYNDYNNINTVYWNFRRAPGFFDVVCYTGAGGSLTVNHNLGVVPELAIIKSRSTAGAWQAAVPSTTQGSFLIGTSGSPLSLNTTNGNGGEQAYSWSGAATATTFLPANIWWNGNASGVTYVAYLFASCPGVSKVGTYTGTGALQTVNCGFTGGARFVLVKATSTTGDWYVWDSARGISSSTDPYLLLNSTAAEVTGTNWVDTTSTGFQVTAASGNLANTNGVSYIFLAVA